MIEQIKKAVEIGKGKTLKIEDCKAVAREGTQVKISSQGKKALNESNDFLQQLHEKRLLIYGINTQFGGQVNYIEPALTASQKDYDSSVRQRQINLIRSHNCGIGPEVSEDIVRAAMLLRAHCLSLGFSGVRVEVVEKLLALLENSIHPVVKRYGSIGASGDLVPLSAIACAIVGENTPVNLRDGKLPASEALDKFKIIPLRPELREGLALINGTSFMTAAASLAFYDLERLFGQMLKAVALSLEGLLVIDSGYDALIHKVKLHTGSQEVNAIMNDFWRGSSLVRKLDQLRKDKGAQKRNASDPQEIFLQDCYSVRSIPQGFGTFKENMGRVRQWIESEMNSVNDNPVVDTKSKRALQGSNFMGYYISQGSDILKMEIAQASAWLHAILANMVNERRSRGLPANLVREPGLYSGFRPIQIAAASLVVQNRKLAVAHQNFMIPTEGDNQDVNSLGTHAALDLGDAVSNLRYLTAILLLAGAQAVELRGLDKAGKEARSLVKKIRQRAAVIDKDENPASSVDAVVQLLKNEEV
ncbi:MAG: aromatic amino acid ammonia-lyase [bacterium]|nr:aromatic amino acid ammonia-lyase [bacterium]